MARGPACLARTAPLKMPPTTHHHLHRKQKGAGKACTAAPAHLHASARARALRRKIRKNGGPSEC